MNFCRLINKTMLYWEVYDKPKRSMNIIEGILWLIYCLLLVVVFRPLAYLINKIPTPKTKIDTGLALFIMFVCAAAIGTTILSWYAALTFWDFVPGRIMLLLVSLPLTYISIVITLAGIYEIRRGLHEGDFIFNTFYNKPVAWLIEKTTSTCEEHYET